MQEKTTKSGHNFSESCRRRIVRCCLRLCPVYQSKTALAIKDSLRFTCVLQKRLCVFLRLCLFGKSITESSNFLNDLFRIFQRFFNTFVVPYFQQKELCGKKQRKAGDIIRPDCGSCFGTVPNRKRGAFKCQNLFSIPAGSRPCCWPFC